ncbi:ATP-binding protein [Streptomyces sp. GS7]|uniref:ATP-binding protein n=1 Tax=Streptomyces sp. GS7 TaxID=2692234 RepID=UPI001316F4BD|nr:ATP-binding protein [Streptomyces sp. GS7]QHC24485.1 ATP-binding protein [Streptomyces sp. GS7]
MTTYPAEPEHDALREGAIPVAERGNGAAHGGWWMPGANDFAACALSGSACTVAEARQFTRTTLQGWRMCPGLADDAVLVVSELVTNALRYGAGETRRTLNYASPEPFCQAWLALTRQEHSVLCAVSDAGATAPVLRDRDELAESGRGLHLVELLSDAWGWTPPDRAGKTVWATVSARG